MRNCFVYIYLLCEDDDASDENQREMAMMLIAKDARVSGALRPWHK